MIRFFDKLFGRRSPAKRKSHVEFVPHGEALEDRAMFSVSNLFFDGSKLIVQSNNSATNAEVRAVGAYTQIKDLTTNRSWTYASNSVGAVEFRGGAGNDTFINYLTTLNIRAFGFGGNDYLEGFNGNDYLDGGDGNDTLKGWGGNDVLFGGTGNDVLLGMTGDDQLVGGDGNDRLNGGAGTDSLWGQNGDDVLITIDNGTADYAEGGAGRDIVWADLNGLKYDRVYGTAVEDKVQLVAKFTNGADKTLDGDRIADPQTLRGQTYKTFAGNQLFSSAGPQATDIRQGSIGDCYMLAAFSAVALDNPQAIRQSVVDFDDGTYGVAFGGRFYRVDNDLPVYAGTSILADAKLGAENSMWVAVMEKAWAHYRTGANSYASIEGGWSIEVNRALGSATAGQSDIQSYGNGTNVLNDLYNRWSTHQAVTIGFLGLKAGTNPSSVPLIMGHMYTVMNFVRNTAGSITGVLLRNPWGVDGAGNDSNKNDGLVTISADQLFRCYGRVNWGRV